MSEDNKALVRRWFAEVDKGNPTIEDELLPADDIDHDPPLPGMAPGREGVKQANALLRAAFPDTVHTIEEQIAEGDKVVTRLSGRGTFQGEILGFTHLVLTGQDDDFDDFSSSKRQSPQL